MVTRHPAGAASAGALTALGSGVEVATLAERTAAARARGIGFPAARDIDYRSLLPLHSGLINNNGDPDGPGRWAGHTHDLEREVVGFFAGLFGGDGRSCWGYVSGGGSSEGVLHGLWLAREHLPDAQVYLSGAAHYCVPKAARLLRMNASIVSTDEGGAMDLSALAAALAAHPHQPAVVVATLGTTMTEALDDVAGIHAVLDTAGVAERHVVVDAALSGPALAADGGPAARLLAPDNFAGADNISVSTHKALGTPHVGGIVLARREHVARIARHVDYVDTLDTTVGGSRSGQTAVEVAHAISIIGGVDGIRARTRAAREVAEYAVTTLTAAGWAAWRHPHAWTVVLAPPSQPLALRWGVPVSDGRAHIICVPGVTRELVDIFVADLTADATRAVDEPALKAQAS